MKTSREPDPQWSEQARATFLEREGRPIFRADWKPALFVHFAVPPALLQPSVPFPLDLRDGRAFVTLVAFSFSKFRVRGLGRAGELLLRPFLASDFLNVRTYVRGPEGPGIFFLREYLSNPLTVPLGPPTFGLPYRYGRLDYRADPELDVFRANIRAASVDFSLTAHHRARPDATKMALPVASGLRPMTGSPATSGCTEWTPCVQYTLAEFLLERYVAYTSHHGKPRFFRIWHKPWPRVECDAEYPERLPEGFGEWTKAARFACAHLSPGVPDVWLGQPRKIKPRAPMNKQVGA